jgi:hypothetical protein
MTGSGGGGAFGQSFGGNGGSGVVILRYPDFYLPPSSVVGSPSNFIINGYRVYIFNASGSITF